MRKQNGFTLVELLVVIGIIGVMMSILLPVMGKVRESSRRTACMAQLRDIGNQFQMYLNEHKQRLPRINFDGRAYGTPADPVPGALPMALLLKPYNGGAYKVFWCPSDYMANPETIIESDEDLQTSGMTMLRGDADTWFERLGSSYEYNGQLNYRAEIDPDRRLMETWPARLAELGRNGTRQPGSIWVFRDCDVFHGKKGADDNRNYLFGDFHVASKRRD